MPTVSAGSQDELRTLIRYERTVELAIEGTRLFDIRRWKYAEHVLPGTTLGRKKREFYQQYPIPTIDEYGQSHYRSEEHTSELQSLMRISYAVICLKKTK